MCINDMTQTPVLKIVLAQPVYNPETGAFEAMARLHAAGTVFSYRVAFAAAPHAAFETVTRALKAQALTAHARAQTQTKRLIRDTVRAAISRTRGAAASRQIGAFLSA